VVRVLERFSPISTIDSKDWLRTRRRSLSFFDFDIHIDDALNPNAGKLSDILISHSLQQGVNSPTHRLGHMLDLFITRDNQYIKLKPVDPPLLSDHVFIVADCYCQTPSSSTPLNFRQVPNWRGIDIDAFAADLEQSSLVVAPPDDVAAFECYITTLLELLNKYAPSKLKRVNTRPSAR
jgi:hypothetical protein